MSKGSKRNKDLDFDGSGDDSDDDFEKDFKSKKNKKTKADTGSEKKLRDRRSNKEDPFEKEIKKAIEMSLKENGVNKSEENISTDRERKNKPDDGKEDEEDFIKKVKKIEPKDSLNSESNEKIVVENENLTNKAEVDTVTEKLEETKEESVKKNKKTPPKKKSKKFESEDEDDDDENFEDEDSEEEFKKSKPKKKTPSKTKKATPGSNKKKSKKPEEKSVLIEKDLNNKSETEVKKDSSKVSVSLKFDEPADETKIIVPKLHSSNSSSSNASRKSFSSIETTNKPEKKSLNTSLNLSAAPSPLGRIEIKTNQPKYRVGLSRNSRVKPLHPNVKLA